MRGGWSGPKFEHELNQLERTPRPIDFDCGTVGGGHSRDCLSRTLFADFVGRLNSNALDAVTFVFLAVDQAVIIVRTPGAVLQALLCYRLLSNGWSRLSRPAFFSTVPSWASLR
jgi:hypothetical protein